MEYALEVSVYILGHIFNPKVLILVLMEYALEDHRGSQGGTPPPSLNPCSNGICSRRQVVHSLTPPHGQS